MACGVPHGFGHRGSHVPESTVFPRQVHGARVVDASAWLPDAPPEADAILSTSAQSSVGIVTADCVPILAAAADGGHVVAIHAGWRGLASGVIEAGLAKLAERARSSQWVAAVGPAARGCCYEVDEPVCRGLARRYSCWLEEPILMPGRPGHFLLDLPSLAVRILENQGGGSARIGLTQCQCTICDPERFESYRRDGAASGRLRHFVEALGPDRAGLTA